MEKNKEMTKVEMIEAMIVETKNQLLKSEITVEMYEIDARRPENAMKYKDKNSMPEALVKNRVLVPALKNAIKNLEFIHKEELERQEKEDILKEDLA